MSFSFPAAKPNQAGYEQSEVDAFIASAREQFLHPDARNLTALDLRRTEFTIRKGGYSVSAVDAAIDRLEDAFADRELKAKMALGGHHSLVTRAIAIKELLRGRLNRPKGRRFKNTGLILRGYDRKQVDAFLASVAAHLDSGQTLNLDSVRRAVFRVKRGGYAESQVDAFIDRVIELLQIERHT